MNPKAHEHLLHHQHLLGSLVKTKIPSTYCSISTSFVVDIILVVIFLKKL